jgi:site-specific recombinase XerD
MSNSQELIVVSIYQPIVKMVINGLDSRHSRRSYERALNDFLAWYEEKRSTYHPNGLTRGTVQAYKSYLRDMLEMAPEYINIRLSAIRRLAREAADNGLLDHVIAQGIEHVPNVRTEGSNNGIWLTKQQAEELIDSPDTTTLKGKRDKAILATLIGGGLRREELTNLTFEHIQQRDGRWAIVNLIGKRHKKRSIPMASWTKAIIDRWIHASNILNGFLFLAMDRGDHITDKTISPQTVLDIVRHYTEYAGLDVDLAPHDLRRTFAKLAYKGGARLDQISMSLGHESLETTQRYLGLEQDFQDAPADHLGLSISV